MDSALSCKLRMTSKNLSMKAPKDTDEESRKELEHGEIPYNYHQKKNKNKTMYAHKCKAHKFTRKRTQETQNKDHEDYIADRGFNSMNHCNLARKPVPILQTMKIPDAKAAVHKEWN